MTARSREAGTATGSSVLRSFRISIWATRTAPAATFAFQTGQDRQGSARMAPVSRQNVTPVACQATGQGHSEHISAAVSGGERLEVDEPGGALAQLPADRGALLPPLGGPQVGAQRGQLLAQGGGFGVDVGGELDQESLAAVAREPTLLLGDRVGVPDQGGQLADRAPRISGGPFRPQPRPA